MRRVLFALLLLNSAAARADDVIRLSMVDLSAQTHKWDGKTIETSAYCFFADVNEFRCVYPGAARVDFTDLAPQASRERIEKNCDTMSKVLSRACLVKLRFVYDRFGTMTNDDGTVLRLVIAKDEKGEIVGR